MTFLIKWLSRWASQPKECLEAGLWVLRDFHNGDEIVLTTRMYVLFVTGKILAAMFCSSAQHLSAWGQIFGARQAFLFRWTRCRQNRARSKRVVLYSVNGCSIVLRYHVVRPPAVDPEPATSTPKSTGLLARPPVPLLVHTTRDSEKPRGLES
jgi:hypothetical protein